MLRLEAPQSELGDRSLSFEDLRELSVTSNRRAQRPQRRTQATEDPCQIVVVIVWRKFNTEMSQRGEMCEGVSEEAKQIGHDFVL